MISFNPTPLMSYAASDSVDTVCLQEARQGQQGGRGLSADSARREESTIEAEYGRRPQQSLPLHSDTTRHRSQLHALCTHTFHGHLDITLASSWSEPTCPISREIRRSLPSAIPPPTAPAMHRFPFLGAGL